MKREKVEMKREKKQGIQVSKYSHIRTWLLLYFALLMSHVPLVAMEWQFAPNTDPKLQIPDVPEICFPDGFKATVRFSCDLAKTGERSGFQNIFMKGPDFHQGYCLMVRKTGQLLIDVVGVEPQYYQTPFHLESNREYTLELYVMKDKLRIFVDGVEKGSTPYTGEIAYATNKAPLKIGSAGGYTFHGSLPYLKLEPLSAVTIPPGGPTPLLEKAPAHQSIADILWTKAICYEKDRYIGWPTTICTKKGRLIAAFSGDRDAHMCPFGKTQVVMSDDGGETWTPPKTVFNSAVDDRDCGLTLRANGEILLMWASGPTWRGISDFMTKDYKVGSEMFYWRRHVEKISAEQIKAGSGHWLMRSFDEGNTWSKPERVKSLGFTPHGPIEMPDGSLMQIGRTHYANSNGITRVTSMRSTDDGRTWQELCYAFPDMNGENSRPQQFHEPTHIVLKDGSILAMIRYEGDDGCLRQSFSKDGGVTFSPMKKTDLVGLPPHLLRLQDGRILCTYGRRLPQPVGYGEFACISADEGKTWDVKNEIFLSAAKNHDLGYPSTAQLPNGDLVTVYYQPLKGTEKPCLMATKWRLTK